MTRIIQGFYTHSDKARDELLALVPQEDSEKDEEMDVDDKDKDKEKAPLGTGRLRGAKSAATPLLPEVDAYLHLVLLLHLLDRHAAATGAPAAADKKASAKKASAKKPAAGSGEKEKELLLECAEAVMRKLVSQNRRSMDHMAARCYYYYTRAYESCGRVSDINGVLHARLRTATLRNDFEGQVRSYFPIKTSMREKNSFQTCNVYGEYDLFEFCVDLVPIGL